MKNIIFITSVGLLALSGCNRESSSQNSAGGTNAAVTEVAAATTLQEPSEKNASSQNKEIIYYEKGEMTIFVPDASVLMRIYADFAGISEYFAFEGSLVKQKDTQGQEGPFCNFQKTDLVLKNKKIISGLKYSSVNFRSHEGDFYYFSAGKGSLAQEQSNYFSIDCFKRGSPITMIEFKKALRGFVKVVAESKK